MKVGLTKNFLYTVIALSILSSGAAVAQVKKSEAYLLDGRAVPARNITNLCWHTSSWTPAQALYECEPDLALRPEKAAKSVAVAAAAAPASAAKNVLEKVILSADTLFDFDRFVLKPEGMQALDNFFNKLAGVKFDLIIAIGYTDRLGAKEYNKLLSTRRAEAVKNYLVRSKGMDPSTVFSEGKGASSLVTGDTCKGDRKTEGLIGCLQPDRRVEIEVTGTRESI